ncbi:MAG: glycosyltransferase [Crocinitomicaceae bacterium]|nr:glycosyltransferase [Crocinitomicaceae bacterium]
MIKVCHISTVHKISDVRVFHKQCVSLAKHFDLYLIITHDKEEVKNGVKVIPLKKSKGRLYRLVFKTTSALMKALRVKAKIYHIHDPELLIVGLVLRMFGKKVVYDIHELVYYQITDKKWLGGMFIRRIVAFFYKGFESLGVRFFNKLALAEKGYYPYFEKHYAKRLDKVMFIRNFPILDLINDQPATEKMFPGKVTLVYAGGLTRIRGIKELCEGVERAETDVRLILLGPWESESFEEECLKDKARVKYVGLKPLNEVFPIMKSADIGAAVLHPLENHMNSSLIKTYEYMACSLPMLLSNFDSWKEEFGPYAIFANPLSVDDIAEKIDWAALNMDQMKEMGAKAREVALANYNWSVEAEKVRRMYESLVNKK